MRESSPTEIICLPLDVNEADFWHLDFESPVTFSKANHFKGEASKWKGRAEHLFNLINLLSTYSTYLMRLN